MADLFGVGVFIFFVPWAVWYGYRTATTGLLYRTLSDTGRDGTTGLVDGEPATIEGEVSVEEPAAASDRAVAGIDSSVAAYVWRALIPRAGANRIDFENWVLTQGKSTFASGLEAGTFTVTDESRSARIDPEWLVDTHEASELSELTIGGVNRSRSFHTYLWDSPYIHLTGATSEQSLKRLRGVVNRHHSDLDLDEYYIESRAISDGQSLAVHGEVRIDQGIPGICGTDETPLVISDRGFDALRSDLRSRIAKHGLVSTVLLGVALSAVVLVPPF